MPDQVADTDQVPARRPQGAPVPGDHLIASPVPLGIGEPRPHLLLDAARAAWDNRDQTGLATRCLAMGVCDECGLGPRGLRDDVLGGVHLCGLRLRALREHTIGALAPADLIDVARLRRANPGELAALGRLPQPFLMRAGDRGFSRISWDDAAALAGAALADAAPAATAFVAGGRGLSDEALYALRKSAALLSSNNVDLCGAAGGRRVLSALEQATGVGASTCSLSDLFAADLVILLSCDLQQRQPVALRYLAEAKRRGTRVVVVDTALDQALQASWTAAGARAAVFGSRIVDDFVQVIAGGTGALLRFVLQQVVARGAVDADFVAARTTGFDRIAAQLDADDGAALLADSGAGQRQAAWLAELVCRARSCVTVIGDRLVDADISAVPAAVDLHLLRGFLGQEGSGLLSLAGPPSLLASRSMGLDPTRLPGGRALADADGLAEHWGTQPLSAVRGLDLPGMLAAAARGELDVLVDLGGDLLAAAPDSARAQVALSRIKLRVHATRFVAPSHLVDAADAVLLLPLESRYEQAGGGVSTSVERRIRFSPEVPGPRLAEARPAWWIPGQLAIAARPELRPALAFEDSQRIRDEIERVVPQTRGIASLRQGGDWVQWGGRQLHGGGFRAMPDGRARFLDLDG